MEKNNCRGKNGGRSGFDPPHVHNSFSHRHAVFQSLSLRVGPRSLKINPHAAHEVVSSVDALGKQTGLASLRGKTPEREPHSSSSSPFSTRTDPLAIQRPWSVRIRKAMFGELTHAPGRVPTLPLNLASVGNIKAILGSTRPAHVHDNNPTTQCLSPSAPAPASAARAGATRSALRGRRASAASDRAARGRTSPGPREEAVLAGRRHVDVVVMRLEAVAERLRHLLLVLDDEDAHIERV